MISGTNSKARAFSLFSYGDHNRVTHCFQYGEYEQVVVEDRIDKEKARRKAEAEAEELKSAVRVGTFGSGCSSVLGCVRLKVYTSE